MEKQVPGHGPQSLSKQSESILAALADAIITADRHGRIEYLNPAAERLLGYGCDEARGEPVGKVFRTINELSGESVIDPVSRCLEVKNVVQLESNTVLIDRHDRRIPIQDYAAPVRNESGALLGVVLVFNDASQQRRLAPEISHKINHDALTGLINRRELLRRMDRVLQSAQQEKSGHVLLFMDLDDIKPVNDAAGLAAGDELIRQVSLLFLGQIRQRDNLARLEGDEFCLLLEHCSLEQAQSTAEKLRQSLQDFVFVRNEYSLSVTMSIGMVAITAQSSSVAELLEAAEQACKQAKNNGKNCIQVGITDPDSSNGRRSFEMNWVEHIQAAIRQDNLVLYIQEVQPVRASPDADSRLQYCELLVRLQYEDGSLLGPDVFIPVAERYQLCDAIDRWVIDRALQYLVENPGFSGQLQHMAINLSGQSVSEEAFLSYVQERLDHYAVDPGKVCFEITETAAISSLSNALVFIDSLKSRGCRFSLDDFGTGLSSYAYLRSLPVDYLKIDGVFIQHLNDNPVDQAMVKSITEIGHLLNKKIIAEYVESDIVLDRLRELGVDFAQGNAIHAPVPLDDYLTARFPQH